MRLDFSIPFYFGLRVVLLLCVGLPSVALAQNNEDFARKRCVDVGFPAGTAGHADCVKQYLESAGRGKPVEPVKPPPDIAIEKQKKKDALERDRQIELEKKTAKAKEEETRLKDALERKEEEVRAKEEEKVKRLEKEKANAPGAVSKDCGECPEMVVVPAGSFMMGSSPDSEPDQFSSTKPQHRVSIKSFLIGKYEVTQEQWYALMGGNPSVNKGGTLPVERVSWSDAQMFIQKLSQKTGKNYRLPSEAEWEYAARAGSITQYFWGDDVKQANDYVWYSDNSFGKSHLVGTKKPNRFGLYDMSGNIWEWTQDCWNQNYSGAPSDGSAWMGENCSLRVLRGGSFGGDPQRLRIANRDWNTSESRYDFLGFRVARTD